MKYVLTLLLALALAATSLAQLPAIPALPSLMEGTRAYRFSWDPNPEEIVAGYTIEFRLVYEDGTKSEWEQVGSVGKVTEFVLRTCPNGAFETRLFAEARDADGTPIARSVSSDILSIPKSPSKPGGFKFEVTTLASDDLVTWVPLATEIVESDKPRQFFKSEIKLVSR